MCALALTPLSLLRACVAAVSAEPSPAPVLGGTGAAAAGPAPAALPDGRMAARAALVESVGSGDDTLVVFRAMKRILADCHVPASDINVSVE